MDPEQLRLDIIEVKQNIGSYYIASIKAKDLLNISYVDRVRLDKEGKNEVASYLGIQRELKKERVKEIGDYILDNIDASFPTSIILAVTQDCAEIVDNNTDNSIQLILKELSDEQVQERKNQGLLIVDEDSNYEVENLKYTGIAKVLDGQHRLAGLQSAIDSLNKKISEAPLFSEADKKRLEEVENFELNVAIFIGYDLHSQAMLFGTVNLAQTKVNKSIVYNLEEYSKIRSPQKICHEIAKILDAKENSPLKNRIKMLGCKTAGRNNVEPLTQAVFVESLLNLISKNPGKERDLEKKRFAFGKGEQLFYTDEEESKFIFHKLYKEKKDANISVIIWNYFSAISQKWPQAWVNLDNSLLPKSNCFRAFMRYLRDAYNEINKDIPTVADFSNKFINFEIIDSDFDSNQQNFPRGDGGMSKFYKYLSGQITYQDLKNN